MLSLPFLAGSVVALARVRHGHPGPRFFDPFDTGPVEPFFENPPPLGFPPDLGGDVEPQDVPGPSQSPGPLPYPQGFVLDVPIHPARDDDPAAATPRPSEPLDHYRAVADVLAACWNPPARFDDLPWRQATLRVSFKRDGSVNGMPRIPYVDQGLTPDARSALTRSLMAALGRCTPLPFSPGLGAAIAGQIFALRFIEQEPDR